MHFPYSTSATYNPQGILPLNPQEQYIPLLDFQQFSNQQMEFINPKMALCNLPQMNFSRQYQITPNLAFNRGQQYLDASCIDNNQLLLFGAAASQENIFHNMQTLNPNFMMNPQIATQNMLNNTFNLSQMKLLSNHEDLSQAVTPKYMATQLTNFPAQFVQIPKIQMESSFSIKSEMDVNALPTRQERNSLSKKLDYESSSTLEKNDRIDLTQHNKKKSVKLNSQSQICSFKQSPSTPNQSVLVISKTGPSDQGIRMDESKKSLLGDIQDQSQDSLGNKGDKDINYSRKRQQTISRPESIQFDVTQHSFKQTKSEKIFDDEEKTTGFQQQSGKSFFLISSYKKKLLASLDPEDQHILIEMRRCKKFNFSKNVIKQFFKVVQTQIDYLYEQPCENQNNEDTSIMNLSPKKKNSNPLAADQNELRQSLKAYLVNNSYTHASIKRLMLHPLFSMYFSDFLEYYTEDWIQQGKTKYKHEQTIMIAFLKLCLKNRKLLIFLSEHDPTKPSKHSKRA